MRRTQLIRIAAGGSAILLIAAWSFQAIGYAPCELCIWQRWPHGAAVLIGMTTIVLPTAVPPLLGAAAAMATGSIGIYHTGVERSWWEGPASCSSGNVSDISVDELMRKILDAQPVRCDEAAWEFLSLSMASWNSIASFALAAIWLAAFRASFRSKHSGTAVNGN